MKLAAKTRRQAGLNLTPLIDVLFILIIFFAVSSTFLEQPAIELKLPEAESGQDMPVEKIIVHVDEDGIVYLMDKPIAIDSLAENVLALIGDDEEKSVTLSADTNAKHGRIISIMDNLRKSGIYKITVSTSKPPM
ncbi:MAG: biopolymer transporter ExbD [candidate division Zixibacteria bacterium]|nr:biopolymer transporter ExbD [candidate division Zixibacteria bacterium]